MTAVSGVQRSRKEDNVNRKIALATQGLEVGAADIIVTAELLTARGLGYHEDFMRVEALVDFTYASDMGTGLAEPLRMKYEIWCSCGYYKLAKEVRFHVTLPGFFTMRFAVQRICRLAMHGLDSWKGMCPL